MLDIKKAREICEAATKGPWKANEQGYYVTTQHEDKNVFCDKPNVDAFGGCLVGESMHKDNARFIAFARTALPEALDEIERLSNLLNGANQALKRAGSSAQFHLKADEMPISAVVFEEKEHPEDVFARQHLEKCDMKYDCLKQCWVKA